MRKRVQVFPERGYETRKTSSGNTVDRNSTRLNSSHSQISYAVFCLKKKTTFHTFALAARRSAYDLQHLACSSERRGPPPRIPLLIRSCPSGLLAGTLLPLRPAPPAR